MAQEKEIIVIAGATGDIGLGLALNLKNEGFRVVGLGRNQEKLSFLQNRGVETKKADTSRPSEVTKIIKEVESSIGKPYCLVTSVGSWRQINRNHSPTNLYAQMGEDFQGVVQAAVIPIFMFNQYFSQIGGGFIVDISSHAAERDLPGNLTYASAKAWVKAMVNNLREENRGDTMGSQVVISRIIAGLVDTPKNRFAHPEIKLNEWKKAVQIADMSKWIAQNINNLSAEEEVHFKSGIIV